MIFPASKDARGFALISVLVFLALSALLLSALLSATREGAAAIEGSAAAAQVRGAVLSGIEYAESQIRPHSFTDLLRGLNRSPESDEAAARQPSFRTPLARAFVLGTDFDNLAYGSNDDGLLHDGVSLLEPSGLSLNRTRLFFKVSNNPEDPGGPFEDTDDAVLVRVLAAIPAPAPFALPGGMRNICEIVEVQLTRTTTFLGPSGIYCPSGQLGVDLTAGGAVLGRAELGTGAAVATGGSAPELAMASGDQLDGNPQVLDLSTSLSGDPRLRWLADSEFVAHWKARIGNYAAPYARGENGPGILWLPEGVELSGSETFSGIVFTAGTLTLRQSARIEGLVVLIDSAGLKLFDSASIAGAVTAVGREERFQVALHGQARIEYRPALASQGLRLLPLSRTRFRYITPEMEM
ncbi:MAG: hypothetical protein HYX74_01560 [Acidobacteria bacterium]|nr:hypothetical protein [Acidobacteriota bacterium]